MNDTGVQRENSELIGANVRGTLKFVNPPSMSVETSGVAKLGAKRKSSNPVSKSHSSGGVVASLLGLKRISCDGETDQHVERPPEEKARKMRRINQDDQEEVLLSQMETTVASLEAEHQALARTRTEMARTVHNLRQELMEALTLLVLARKRSFDSR